MATVLRRAVAADIPAIRELRLSVGWQAHDWALLAAMEPPHAAFLAIEEDGRLTAIGSGIAYGRLGIVGNMVVAADRRRRGLGSRILREVLGFLEARGVERVELFATRDGRRLYQRFGFTALAVGAILEIERGRALAAAAADVKIRAAKADDLPALASYDLPRYGGDRTPILRGALDDPERPTVLAVRDGSLAGFAVVRPAGMRLGPWIADDTRAAGALLAAATERLPGAPLVAAHVPGENERGHAWLTGLGATTQRADGRMARGVEIERRFDTIYGSTMGALG